MESDLASLLSRLHPSVRLWTIAVLGILPFIGLVCISCAQPPAAKQSAPVPAPAAVDVRLVRRALTGEEARAYAGNAACTSCHADIVQRHAASRHARTLRPVTEEQSQEFANTQAVTDARMGVKYTTSFTNGRCLMTGERAQGGGSVPADYVIGAGKNAHTFFFAMDPTTWIDLRISYYTQAKRWDFTPMQRPENKLPSDSGIAQVGERLSSCLLCHVTVLRQDAGQLNIRDSQVGIGCERCHGPGKAHVEIACRPRAAIEAIRSSIDGLQSADPARTNSICGDCHRSAENSPKGDPHVEHDLARFQGAALVRSRCFIKSGTLSCNTCHSPHTDAETSPAFYDAKCLTCHRSVPPTAQSPAAHSLSAPLGGHSCPVNSRSGCTECHMPRQAISGIPYAKYANHWIKVWRRK